MFALYIAWISRSFEGIVSGNSILHDSNVYPETIGGIGKLTEVKSSSNKNVFVSKVSFKRSLKITSKRPISYFAYKVRSDDGIEFKVNASWSRSSINHPLNSYPSLVGVLSVLNDCPNANVCPSNGNPPLTSYVIEYSSGINFGYANNSDTSFILKGLRIKGALKSISITRCES